MLRRKGEGRRHNQLTNAAACGLVRCIKWGGHARAAADLEMIRRRPNAAVDKKIVVVPPEAKAVRTIFARYLQLGSIRALAEDLDRRGIRSKPRRLSHGRTVRGGRFGVGALAHLLKNRFYIGEVVYRGEVRRGEHEPILEPALFEAVQGKLAAQAVARRSRLRGSPALLTARLFDVRGNRMSPSHCRACARLRLRCRHHSPRPERLTTRRPAKF
jgi:Recombinase